MNMINVYCISVSFAEHIETIVRIGGMIAVIKL